MQPKNYSFYIYDISFIMKESILHLRDKILCKNLINIDEYRRKNIINFEIVSSYEQSSLSSIENLELLREGSFDLNSKNKKLGEFGDKVISVKDLSLEENKIYNYQVYSFIDIPESIKTLESNEKNSVIYKESEIFNLYIIISENLLNDYDKNQYLNSRIYEGYNHFGFILVELNSFNEFLINHPRKISNDLIEEFTTTELASELFDEGIMALCWGMNSWPYYVCTETDKEDKLKIPKGKITDYIGTYNFKNDIERVSVIPGNAISNWKVCLENEWPILDLEGDGNGISISLYINHELSIKDRVQTGIESPIATFSVKRINVLASKKIEPMLKSSIFE